MARHDFGRQSNAQVRALVANEINLIRLRKGHNFFKVTKPNVIVEKVNIDSTIKLLFLKLKDSITKKVD